MAYTLTFGDGIHYRVNGTTSSEAVNSPYVLKSGDSIYMHSDFAKFTINDELYEDANENVVNISDKDIAIATSGSVPSMSSGYNTAIHFSATETPKALSFRGKILKTPSGKILSSRTRSTQSYKVTLYNSNVTLSNYGPAVKGVNFVTTLQPNVGYSAPKKSKVSVKIGGTVYTGFTYTQNSDATGTLTIPAANVTGDIVITANGEQRSKWTVSIVQQNAEDGWYVTTERYVQGVLTTVHLNDGDNIYQGEKLTYYAEAKPGYLTTRDKAVISGDVVVSGDITVSFKFPNNASYPVSVNVTHLTFAGASMATHGTNYTATITPASGYTLPSTVAVTIGGNNYTGHTWNSSTGALTIPGADIIGSIAVAATAGAASAGYALTVTAEQDRGSLNITYADGRTADVSGGVYSNVKQINSYMFMQSGDQSWNINGSQPALPYVLTADSTAYVYSACIIEGTLVTLADGTTKPIENITYDDDLLVWNFYEGKFDHAKPIWVKPAGVVTEYNLCKFDNGAGIGLVGPGIYHRIYNNEAHAFTHTGSDDTPIGTTTFTDHGDFTKLVSQEIVHKTVRYYNVVTDKHYNIFANGILTSSRISNRYGIENDMRYNLNDVRMTESEVEDYIAKLPR